MLFRSQGILGDPIITSAIHNITFPTIDQQKGLIANLSALKNEVDNFNSEKPGTINAQTVDQVVSALQEVFKISDGKKDGKYFYKEAYKQVVTKKIAIKFKEIFSSKGVEDKYLSREYKSLNKEFEREVAIEVAKSTKKSVQKTKPSNGNEVVALDKGWTVDYQNQGWYNPVQKNAKGVQPKKADPISTYMSSLGSVSLNRRYVSYGLLFERLIMMSALAQPTINDVQVFFGQLSKDSRTAGAFETGLGSIGSRGMSIPLNIAEFPIDSYIFLEKYKKTVIEKGTEQLTLGEMLEILNFQVGDPRAIAYGFRSFFKPFDPENQGYEFTNEDVKIKGEIALKEWKPPQIGVSIETLQIDDTFRLGKNDDLLRLYETSARDKRLSGNNNTQVMRLKVFDRNNSKTIIEQLASPEQEYRISQSEVSDAKSVADALTTQLNQYGYRDIKVELVGNNDSDNSKRYVLNFPNNKVVKDFFSSKLPTIIIGANNSNIINSNMSTNQDARLTTSLIMKGFEGNTPGEPLGLNLRGLPVGVQPGAVNLTIVGCPIINYMQGFFIDFGTGTSVDNAYYVVDANHQFSPGKFQTTMKLAFADSITPYRDPRNLDGLIAALKGTTNFNFKVPGQKT